MSDDQTPETLTAATPVAHPAWVYGPGPGPGDPDPAAGHREATTYECAACHAKTLDWAGKDQHECWVCGRITLADGTLVPRPDPDEET